MKKLYVIIILYPFFCFGQISSINLDQNVSGLISTSDGVYLILEQGFMQISQTDIYTEYYREIYNDSTLVNPNTEIRTEYDLNIIPYIMPNEKQQQITFDEPLNIGIFVNLNEAGKLNLTTYGSEILDSLAIP